MFFFFFSLTIKQLWNNHDGFISSYFERFNGKWFDTGDSGFKDADGYVHIMSRSDDIINVAAHRLSTGSIEQVLVSIPGIAEACVVGKPDEQKGHVPLAFVSFSSGQNGPSFETINKHVRQEIGAIASLAGVIPITERPIPKTRSGKTLRRVLRTLVENAVQGKFDQEVPIPPTIEDPLSVESARAAVKKYFKGTSKL